MKKLLTVLSLASISILTAQTITQHRADQTIQKPTIADNEPLGPHWCRYHPGVCSIFGAPKTPTQPPPTSH
jgi:hypothetical protein